MSEALADLLLRSSSSESLGDAEWTLQSYLVIELPDTPEGNDHFRI
jgi:hypothetical protein